MSQIVFQSSPNRNPIENERTNASDILRGLTLAEVFELPFGGELLDLTTIQSTMYAFQETKMQLLYCFNVSHSNLKRYILSNNIMMMQSNK